MTDVALSKWQVAQRHEQDFWEAYADTYARYPQILLEHLTELTEAGEYVREELRSSEVKEVLEVGIGPLGIGVLGMRASNASITGIDPLPQINFQTGDEALDAYIRTLRERVEYQCSPGENLPLDDSRFDFVCCHNVIDHADNPLAILQEIFRVLKKKSWLYLTLNTFSFFGRLKFEGLRRLQPEKMLFACHPHSFLHADILKILTDIGFDIVRHDGDHSALFGHGRLSKFLCRKAR